MICIKKKSMLLLHVPWYSINLCKVMQIQTKFMKKNWLSACGGGDRVRFTSANKRSYDGEDLNTLVISALSKALKIKKGIKLKLRMNPTLSSSKKSELQKPGCRSGFRFRMRPYTGITDNYKYVVHRKKFG